MSIFTKFVKSKNHDAALQEKQDARWRVTVRCRNRALAKAALEIYPEREEVRTNNDACATMLKKINRQIGFYGCGIGKETLISVAVGVVFGMLAGIPYGWLWKRMGHQLPDHSLEFVLPMLLIVIGVGVLMRDMAVIVLDWMQMKYYECEAEHYLLTYLHPGCSRQSFNVQFRLVPFMDIVPAFFYDGDDPKAKNARAMSHFVAEAIIHGCQDDQADLGQSVYEQIRISEFLAGTAEAIAEK